MQGQSNDQLSKDRYECHVWVIQSQAPVAAPAQDVYDRAIKRASPDVTIPSIEWLSDSS